MYPWLQRQWDFFWSFLQTNWHLLVGAIAGLALALYDDAIVAYLATLAER